MRERTNMHTNRRLAYQSIYLTIYLSIDLIIYVPVCLPVQLSSYLPMYPTGPAMYLSVPLSFYLSIRLSIALSINQSRFTHAHARKRTRSLACVNTREHISAGASEPERSHAFAIESFRLRSSTLAGIDVPAPSTAIAK